MGIFPRGKKNTELGIKDSTVPFLPKKPSLILLPKWGSLLTHL